MADPADTPATNAPLMSPATSGLVTSGVSSIPVTLGTTGNWYIHTQSIAVTYLVNNQYDTTLSSPVSCGPPSIKSNFLHAKCQVQSTDIIQQGYTYSGESFIPQNLTMMSTGASGGLGTSGSIQTTLQGYVRKVADTDAAGNFTDPQGTCMESFETIVNNQPGPYRGSLDTSSNANFVLNQIIIEAGTECLTFDPLLVQV